MKKMFESRCGVECSSCERRENGICKGCLAMECPFWGGECKTKNCCESQSLNHCGECNKFPCEMLYNMGKKFGYDPLPKIERCRKWAVERK